MFKKTQSEMSKAVRLLVGHLKQRVHAGCNILHVEQSDAERESRVG